MTWNQRYRVASYLRSSLWIVPFSAIILQVIFAVLVKEIGVRTAWTGLGLGLEGAKAVCSTVITFSLSFVVFTFGSLLVAIQVASGQYTPRIIATTLLQDNVIRYTVGLFVFTLLVAVRALNRIESDVPQLLTFLTGLLGFVCLAAFLFLIDYAARMLRPVSLVTRVGEEGLKVIHSIYPEMLDDDVTDIPLQYSLSPTPHVVYHVGRSAIVCAVNIPALVREADLADCVFEFVPQVGDFLGAGEPLFRVHGLGKIDESRLRDSIIFGSERTMEQDPLFAIRILVDIAIKALSAAINDPTTAVLAIDQIQRLLRRVGRRNLGTDKVMGISGDIRLIFRTPDWEDFVHLAFTEIRTYGSSNVQIARRLRAMILNLVNGLPPTRESALYRELNLLDRMIEKAYLLAEDLQLARVPDTQGLGGSPETSLTMAAAQPLTRAISMAPTLHPHEPRF